jgi:hypothetical protein
MAGIAGVAYIKVDGKQYTLAGSMTIALARVSREGLVGLSGVAGYKETPRVPFIEVELYADENTDLEDIEWFKVWSMLTSRLADSKTLSAEKRLFCSTVFQALRQALVASKPGE